MSEYWKSTPKYWCKYCKVYVRDTDFEKKNHEATGRHQSNIQRSLRTLHRDNEREEREKARAKAEVARLNGVVSGQTSQAAGKPTSSDVPWAKRAPVATKAPEQKSSREDRMRQAEQLASMGVAIPDEYRKDLAMASSWQVVSETPIVPKEDLGPEAKAVGVRKRKLEEDEQEYQAQRVWGTSVRKYPSAKAAGRDDLDDLLSGETLTIKTKPDPTLKSEAKEETVQDKPDHPKIGSQVPDDRQAVYTKKPGFKKSQDEGDAPRNEESNETPAIKAEDTPPIKTEEDSTPAPAVEAPVVFKKRKPGFVRRT